MADKYDIQAQYVPALVTSVPYAAFAFYYLSLIPTSFPGHVLALGVGGLSMSVALFQVDFSACRYVGKRLEELIYHRERKLPTTDYLLDGDGKYTDTHRADLRKKIEQQYDLDLTGVREDNFENRRRIAEVIRQVRRPYFKKEGLVRDRNIQYGRWRNIFGGSLIAVCWSALSMIIALILGQSAAFIVSLLLFCAYLILGVFSYFAMRLCARYYADALFDDLLAL